MTRIPLDPIGYKVDADGMIHTRYATHATGQRPAPVGVPRPAQGEAVIDTNFALMLLIIAVGFAVLLMLYEADKHGDRE